MEPDTQEPQHNISYEAMITDHTSETGASLLEVAITLKNRSQPS
jgi:hypothetical protein